MSAIRLSFETFPPKHETGSGKFMDMLSMFQKYNPTFQSMTYGAGASDRSRSETLIPKVLRNTDVKQFVPHLTGGGQRKDEIENLVSGWWNLGIRHIVALRGDAETDSKGTIKCAAELVEVIRNIADFEISVAGYPEVHPKSESKDLELQHLKRKTDTGASRVLTQFFFDPDVFLHYRDACAKAQITAEIIPGILPISSIEQVARFAGQCGASIPQEISDRFKGLENQPDAIPAIAVATVVELIDRLSREGVEDFHLYTLNNTSRTVAICHSLGIYPDHKLAA